VSRAERAYRPDQDLVSAALSNLGELLAQRGDLEEAILQSTKAVRLTDMMEHVARERTKDHGQGARVRRGDRGGAGSSPVLMAHIILILWDHERVYTSPMADLCPCPGC
jgi:hypothetical protein